ncbi:hypothetical protein SOVF_208000, partial [Spinacia oleracea]
MLETGPIEDVVIAPASVVRAFVLDPKNVSNSWINLMMLSNQGDLHPAHLPDIADMAFLPEHVRALFYWEMAKLAEKNSSNVVPEAFAVFMDPPPVLPRNLEVILMEYSDITIQTISWSNVVKMVRVQRRQTQIQLHVRWEYEGALELGRPIKMCLEPRHCFLFDPVQGRDRDYMMEGGGLEPFGRPPTPFNMSVLYWNARGIARSSFSRNISLLIQQHQPYMIVISELRVSRANTEVIVCKLPYDEWMMVDPIGLSGGIVVLWRSRFVSFEPIRTSTQGIHGIIQ